MSGKSVKPCNGPQPLTLPNNRPLTDKEMYDFELSLAVDGADRQALAEKFATEYPGKYIETAIDFADKDFNYFESTIRNAFGKLYPAPVKPSVGDFSDFAKTVLGLLKKRSAKESKAAAPTINTPAGPGVTSITLPVGAGATTAPTKSAEYGANNTLVSQSRADEIRQKLRAKLSQLNAGIDPEIIALGTELAVFHLEAGARKFADFARALIADLGETARPFLFSWYDGAKRYPGMDRTGLTKTSVLEMAEERDLWPGDVYQVEGKEKTVSDINEYHVTWSDGTQTPTINLSLHKPRWERISRVGEVLSTAIGGTIVTSKTATQENSNGFPDTGKDQEDGGDGAGRHGADQVPAPTGDGRTPAVSGTTGDGNDRESGNRTGSGNAGIGRTGGTGAGLRQGTGLGVGLPSGVESDSQQPPGISGRAGRGLDFRATPAALARTGSWLETAKRNVDIIELTQRLEQEHRKATAEEQQLLARHVGFGASEIRNPLFPSWQTPKGEWAALQARLVAALSADELATLKQSTQYAHYTSPTVVAAMWRAMQRIGFAGGRVLEPSMGIGNFFGMMPRELMANSQLTGIELDALTGGMAKLLYHDANIRIMPYQNSQTADGFYDLAIGNWPFFEKGPADRRYNALSPSLHDYFFHKTLDQVRVGGLVIGITSAGTMDKVGRGTRLALGCGADGRFSRIGFMKFSITPSTPATGREFNTSRRSGRGRWARACRRIGWKS